LICLMISIYGHVYKYITSSDIFYASRYGN